MFLAPFTATFLATYSAPLAATRLMAVSAGPWPDSLDLAATIVFCVLVVAVPLVGYVFMALDVRRYLRALRRALVVVSQPLSSIPSWARRQTPACLAVFGLRLPCSEEELKCAYRRKVKQLHPDSGGDQRQFLELQRHFERGLQFIAEQQTPAGGPESAQGGGM